MADTSWRELESTPAGRVIAAFGSPEQVARAIGRVPSTVYRWTYDRNGPSRGTGGLIPVTYHAPILAAARARGISLTAEDLVDWNAVDRAS